jgi:selT/selW/selH-like putative selenoprotein
LAAEIKKEFGVDSKLIRGGSGTFLVTVDGKKIFSKHEEGRFPTEREILDQLRTMQAK